MTSTTTKSKKAKTTAPPLNAGGGGGHAKFHELQATEEDGTYMETPQEEGAAAGELEITVSKFEEAINHQVTALARNPHTLKATV